MKGPFVRISPTEIAISDLDAFKRIHRIGDGFPKPDWYMKLVNPNNYLDFSQ